MENCFRFLINVDQCLNMSYFDIFFYKLKSQHKFHLNNVQMFGGCADSSVHSAVTDIRLYLDKYPYHVGDFQIIVALRSTFCAAPASWEDTMLYRLLQIDHELRLARIFINSREQIRKALNLVMLYDTDFSAELPALTSYMDSQRLEHDCAMLLSRMIPAECPQTPEELIQRCNTAPADPARDLLLVFAADQQAQTLRLRRIAPQLDQHFHEDARDPERCEDSMPRKLARFVKDQLFNFQIFEAQIDRNNRRQNILALLRLTDFINADTESDGRTGGGQVSLSQRCVENWDRIWNDPELEKRYAAMLQDYRLRLNMAAVELEQPKFCTPDFRDIPTEEIPHSQAITCNEGYFADPELQTGQTDLRRILQSFTDNRFSLRTLRENWDQTYRQCRQLLDQMDYALRDYAQNLSRQYSAALESRKRESIIWRNGIFTAEPGIEKDISRLAYERDQRLEQLKSPHMTPSLSFQDQLNMENSLEQGNMSIRFYIQCLSAMTVGGFLLLILACALMGFGHYTFLQPYVFQSSDTALCYFVYLAAATVLMLVCWTMPYHYFRRKLRVCIKQLQEDAEKYITGYYDKAAHFCNYINLLNQLDYITRRHRLLTRAYTTIHRLSQGYLWHKVQVQKHLEKLRFFQGLIELSNAPGDDPGEQLLPTIDGDRVSDVIDSQVYWPQR